MASTQRITATLRAAGFKSAKKVRVREEDRSYTKITEGYRVFRIAGLVGVECCHCMSQKDAMVEALEAAGLTVTERGNSGILAIA